MKKQLLTASYNTLFRCTVQTLPECYNAYAKTIISYLKEMEEEQNTILMNRKRRGRIRKARLEVQSQRLEAQSQRLEVQSQRLEAQSQRLEAPLKAKTNLVLKNWNRKLQS